MWEFSGNKTKNCKARSKSGGGYLLNSGALLYYWKECFR